MAMSLTIPGRRNPRRHRSWSRQRVHRRGVSTAIHHALAAAGITSTSVATVVNSHLHFDHCGQNPLLYGTDVAFFVGRVEIEQVDSDPYYTDSTWALPPLRQRCVVDGDLEIAEGVTILSTLGHTAGHQSVLIDSDEGRIVIGAQVVCNTYEFVDEVATESNVDGEELRIQAVESIRRLKALRASVVHFSHYASHRGDDAS